MRTFVWSLAIGLLMAVPAAAESVPACAPADCGSPQCCSICRRQCGCEKYCKLTCEMKEVKKTVWECKCEEFCPLLPGCRDCCDACTRGNCCGKCKTCCDPCHAENSRTYVPPQCGHMRCRKVLEKKEVTCKVPRYKCVVVYCCPSCAANGGAKETPAPAPVGAPAPVPAPAPIPPPPAPAPPKTAELMLPPALVDSSRSE